MCVLGNLTGMPSSAAACFSSCASKPAAVRGASSEAGIDTVRTRRVPPGAMPLSKRSGRCGWPGLLQEYSRTKGICSAVTVLSMTMPLSAKSSFTWPPMRNSILPGASHSASRACLGRASQIVPGAQGKMRSMRISKRSFLGTMRPCRAAVSVTMVAWMVSSRHRGAAGTGRFDLDQWRGASDALRRSGLEGVGEGADAGIGHLHEADEIRAVGTGIVVVAALEVEIVGTGIGGTGIRVAAPGAAAAVRFFRAQIELGAVGIEQVAALARLDAVPALRAPEIVGALRQIDDADDDVLAVLVAAAHMGHVAGGLCSGQPRAGSARRHREIGFRRRVRIGDRARCAGRLRARNARGQSDRSDFADAHVMPPKPMRRRSLDPPADGFQALLRDVVKVVVGSAEAGALVERDGRR